MVAIRWEAGDPGDRLGGLGGLGPAPTICDYGGTLSGLISLASAVANSPAESRGLAALQHQRKPHYLQFNISNIINISNLPLRC